MRPLRLLGLCSGSGLLDRAVEQVTGAELVAYAETDPHACKVMAHHWPECPNLGDITSIDWDDVALEFAPDVICGGFPCQPFSQAGKRKGVNDHRHLWPAIFAAISHLRPSLVFLENVRGHLSLGFDVVLSDLASVGFDAEWGVLRASDVGCCHRRERLWIVAYPSTRPAADAINERRDGTADRAEQAGGGHAERGDPVADPDESGREGAQPARGPDVPAGADPRRALTGTMLPTPAARQADRGMPNRDTAARRRDTEGRRHLEDSIALLPTTTAKDGAASRNRTCVRQPDAKYTIGTTLTDVAWLDAWGEYGTAIARHAATFGTPPPAPTVLGTKGQPALSPRFSEWMMAAPAGWVTELDIPRTEQLRILGNSIVGPCAVAAFAELLGRAGTSPESGA